MCEQRTCGQCAHFDPEDNPDVVKKAANAAWESNNIDAIEAMLQPDFTYGHRHCESAPKGCFSSDFCTHPDLFTPNET